MANYFICLVVQRLVLPLILATCCLMRPVGLALPYLLFLFILPFVPVATPKSLKGSTGVFLRLLVAISVLLLALQIIFQIVCAAIGYDLIARCQFTEILLRHVGLVTFYGLDAAMVVYWMAPDVLQFLGSIIVLVLLKKLANAVTVEETFANDGSLTAPCSSLEVPESIASRSEDRPEFSSEKMAFLRRFGVLLSVGMLCLSAVLQPSVPSGIYFIIFLGSATWWACYRELDRAFAIILRITLFFLVVHITGFLAYQNPWPQELLPVNDTIARILALTPILTSSCDLAADGTDIRYVHFDADLDSDYYLNPIVLIISYYCIAISSSLLLKPRTVEKEIKRQELFCHLENGVKMQRQISFRMQRKNILRKTLTSDRWRGAALKVKLGRISKSQRSYGRSREGTARPDLVDERTPLMRGGTRKVRDASTSEAQGTAQTDNIAMQTIGSKPLSEEEESTSFFEQIMLAAGNVASFIYKNSYIFTNVIMMTWSIMYHSWLTFVLLIWANLIWILPNQRKNMLNSSPFLVIYAELLLLAQYLYGMKLTDDELPSSVNVTGINLAQIGFVRYSEYPCSPLLIKSLFTTMFWISLRQMIQEKQMERRTSTIADLAAPLQVTVGAATTAASGPGAARTTEKKSSAFISRAGALINSFLIKFWIWVVAITLFLSGITGTRMTGFRIVYMALFLIFVLTFQFSFKVWRKMMYTFWLTVIVYSMSILVLVYTYQFDEFPTYWEKYLKISDTLQKDIGLESYATKQLFLHLVNPTLIVIITVIQLHYCHKKFLEISEIPSIQNTDIPVVSETSSAYGTFSRKKKYSNTTEAPPIEEEQNDERPAEGEQHDGKKSDSEDNDDTSQILEDLRFRKLSRQEIKSVAKKLADRITKIVELVWLFFEIHLLKIILIVAFSLGVDTVSFLHVLYIILTVFAVKSHTGSLVLITRIMSLISSILLITTMIYQVDYIDHSRYESVCPNIDVNVTKPEMNNAKWIGFQKTDALNSLSDLIRPYLIYIIVVTIHAVVVLRQTIRRMRLGLPPRTPPLMFPNVTRTEADRDILHMVMYLFNYGFYKFGVEMTLVALIVVIGSRMDIFSCFYAVWLCVMFHMTRERLLHHWRFITWFTVALIPLQYIIFVGLPPMLCVDYPWNIPFLEHFRIWAMLPENTAVFRAQASKMVSDFLLLMFLCRQTLVFRIEMRYCSCPNDFGGGSNKSVLGDIDKLDSVPFVNPTPDFIARIRNWLDVLKRGLFLVFFWFTLAIVFLTGSSRVNLFSIGYLIGAFTFLWQGTDFYLRAIRSILKAWNMLIAYNVFVITTKTLLQLIGCLTLRQLAENNCWVIQLFGITCLSSKEPEKADNLDPNIGECNVPYDDAGLFLDGVCFAFLLLQRRIFSSYYFCHIINETKASTMLASRGAELIEELRIKDVKLEAEKEIQILEKIKAKMDRIKATQQKILEPVNEPTHAKDDAEKRHLLPTHSLSSYTGYHTPIEDEIAGNSMFIEGEGLSEIPSDNGGLTVGRGSIHTQSTAAAETQQAQSPRSPRSPRSTTFAAAHPRHRRLSSMGTCSGVPDDLAVDPGTRRRSSFLVSLFVDDDTRYDEVTTNGGTRRRSRSRSFWGPVGEAAFRDSVRVARSRSPSSHHESIRSGDYYMFEDIEHEFELDLMPSRISDDDLADGISPTSRKLSRKLTLGKLMAKIKKQKQLELQRQAADSLAVPGSAEHDTERRRSSPNIRRASYMREQIGHASAAGQDRSAISEPLPRHTHVDARGRKRSGVDETDGQRPGTSKDLPGQQSITDEEAHLISDDEGDATDRPIEGKRGKFSLSGLALIPAFLAGALGSLTLRLHRVSRSYRYVMRVLAREKRALMETPGFGAGMRTGSGLMWTPIQGTGRSNSSSRSGSQSGESTSVVRSRQGSPASSRHLHSSNANKNFDPSASIPPSPSVSTTQPATAVSGGGPKQTSFRDEPDYLVKDEGLHQVSGLGAALAMINRKDQTKEERSSSFLPDILISAPTPERGLDVDGILYRYGSCDTLDSKMDASIEAVKLAKDEKSSEEDFATQSNSVIVEFLQAVWYAILSHTDFICYFLVFLNQIKSASLLSLPLPLIVTLWGTLTFPRPSKTFWVTLIAYTQTVVLLKCICQFEMLWWNQNPIPPNQPFSPARLIGIEQKKGYATYDLALLLVLFCHRFILKSLGLWKSDFVEEPSLSEGFYKVDINDERTKTLMDAADEAEKDNETLVVRQDDNTELTMVKVEDAADYSEAINGSVVQVTQHSDDASRYFPRLVKNSFQKYTSSVKAFFNQLLDRQSRKTADVYGYLFLCDFINFFVILFGFSSFGTQEGDGGVLSYFEENKVPVTFLLMLIIQFFLIVIDRALYLRKYMFGKILFQFFLIIGLHIWMFFVLPATTERSFNATNPPVYYYLIKCFYLLFSAYQIRCGYPARILGNFVTKGFTMINFTGFKLFMTIPFLFELRTLMDWIWTDTSMTLFDWLKMEDIFANVYQLKCTRQFEEDLPAPRGQKKGSLVKYLMGGGMMAGIIFLIWFPLALFAFSNAVGEPNLPYDVSVTLRIGPYEPVYLMSAQDNNIHGLNENEWERFMAPYAKDRTALTFLSNYEPVDVAAVKLGANSTSIWNISPPDRTRLLNDLNGTTILTCRFRYTISRNSHSKENPGTVSEEQSFELGPQDPARAALLQMLANDTDISVALPFLMPKFLKVKNSGSVRPIHQLMPFADNDDSERNYRNISLRLFQTHTGESVPLYWWEVKEECGDPTYQNYFANMPYADCLNHLVMYMFNDKIFPSTISSIAAGGIIGIYSTLILVFSRMLRTSIFSGASSKIMFEDLPYVDRVVQLCLDIYLVRESSEFTLEEDLFAKLIFLYRSPETMIKWTRPKHEEGDGDSDTMSNCSETHKKNE